MIRKQPPWRHSPVVVLARMKSSPTQAFDGLGAALCCKIVSRALSCPARPITLWSVTASFMVNTGKAHVAARNAKGYFQQMGGYPSHRINKHGYFFFLKIVILFFFKTLKIQYSERVYIEHGLYANMC